VLEEFGPLNEVTPSLTRLLEAVLIAEPMELSESWLPLISLLREFKDEPMAGVEHSL